MCIYTRLSIFVLGWQGLWEVVQEQAVFWLILLLLFVFLLIPPLVPDLCRKPFYPEFRDLAIEAECFGLDMAPLQKWEVPLDQRSLPLLKSAPRMSKPGGCLRRGARAKQAV